jgi:hypothetical protein
MITSDKAGFFECAHAAQAGRGRDADTLRQLHIRHAAVFLQLTQNAQVNAVEFDVLHPWLYEKINNNGILAG